MPRCTTSRSAWRRSWSARRCSRAARGARPTVPGISMTEVTCYDVRAGLRPRQGRGLVRRDRRPVSLSTRSASTRRCPRCRSWRPGSGPRESRTTRASSPGARATRCPRTSITGPWRCSATPAAGRRLGLGGGAGLARAVRRPGTPGAVAEEAGGLVPGRDGARPCARWRWRPRPTSWPAWPTAGFAVEDQPWFTHHHLDLGRCRRRPDGPGLRAARRGRRRGRGTRGVPPGCVGDAGRHLAGQRRGVRTTDGDPAVPPGPGLGRGGRSRARWSRPAWSGSTPRPVSRSWSRWAARPDHRGRGLAGGRQPGRAARRP